MVHGGIPVDGMGALVDLKKLALVSDPPKGCKKVTNMYIEFVNGNPKLRVEYEC